MANPSIRQIAENVNISVSTVSLILNGRADEMRISKETQKKVLEEAQKLHYQPNVYARRLRHKGIENERKVIAVLCPDFFGEEVMGRFILAVNRCVLEKNLLVEIVIKPYLYGNIASAEGAFANNLFNGIIIMGASEADAEYVSRLQTRTPILYFNYADSTYSSVCWDEAKLGEMVSELFRKRNHKSVAIVEPDAKYSKMTGRRIEYLRQQCEKKDLSVKVYLGNEKTEKTEDFFRRMVGDMKGRENRPTAIILMRSTRYWPLYTELSAQGFGVPEDVEVMGFTDFGYARYLRPALTVIDFPVEQMVESALQMIQSQMQSGNRDRLTVWSAPKLIVRETCGGMGER